MAKRKTHDDGFRPIKIALFIAFGLIALVLFIKAVNRNTNIQVDAAQKCSLKCGFNNGKKFRCGKVCETVGWKDRTERDWTGAINNDSYNSEGPILIPLTDTPKPNNPPRVPKNAL